MLDHAREHLRANVDGVHRRIAHARSYVANPWIRLGAAFAVGYLLGCNEDAKPAIRAPRRRYEPNKPETIVHAVVRAAAAAFVTAAIRQAVSGGKLTPET